MSVKKYLTLSGLTYFLNKIKTYLTSSTYLNSIGISNTDIDDIADDAGYSSGSLPASEDIFITGDIIPNTDNSVDLGASSKNIKMIYTKGITINGVAWGLDKVNTWTAQQKIVGSNSSGKVSIYNRAYTKGGTLSVTEFPIGTIYMGDAGQLGIANSLGFISTDLASNGARTLLSLSAMENTASSTARTNVIIQYDKNDAENPRKVTIQGSILPHAHATYSLGTSTSKWKSFNGVNPGALSLQGTGVIDVSSNITALDGTTQNKFTPQINGWLHINGTGPMSDGFIYAVQGRIGMKSANNMSYGRCAVLIPVVAGVELSVTCKLTTLTWANITPCQGNV